MVDVSKHSFRGEDGRTYTVEQRTYENGPVKTITTRQADSVVGLDQVVKVETRNR